VKASADGQACQLTNAGRAKAGETEAQGIALAKGLKSPAACIGKDQTTLVNVVKALSDGSQRFMPENLALSVGGGGLNALTSLPAMTAPVEERIPAHLDVVTPHPYTIRQS
jgi:hypothetical protein